LARHERSSSLPRPVFDRPVKLLIVAAPYYRDIVDNLTAGAGAAIEASGGTWDLAEVPGALEVPTAIAMADRWLDFDGYVALGCVIRGETTHYDTVCADSSRALQLLGLQGLCIGNGILTVESRAQAEARAEPGSPNKGDGAALAALHLIALGRNWAGKIAGTGSGPPAEDSRIAPGDDGTTEP